MKEAVDLHAHTNRSDGTLTPVELVRLAKEKGLAAVAVTDHDTTAGVEEALAEGERIGIRVIPGIEMSTSLDGCDVHLIGLFVDIHNAALQDRLHEVLEDRNERNKHSVRHLQEKGFLVSQRDLDAYGADKILTRGNIAEILVKKGYAEDIKDAMEKYMCRGKVGYARRRVPDPSECIRLLHNAGARVFVAHLHQIDLKDPEHSMDICRRILAMGADGLETEYCEFDEVWKVRAKEIAGEYDCLESGGSDFHGSLKKGLELGTGYGDLFVPAAFLERM